jgi:hypothetical protein
MRAETAFEEVDPVRNEKSPAAAFRRARAPGGRAGRTGVVGKQLLVGLATVENRSQTGKRHKPIGFPPEW